MKLIEFVRALGRFTSCKNIDGEGYLLDLFYSLKHRLKIITATKTRYPTINYSEANWKLDFVTFHIQQAKNLRIHKKITTSTNPSIFFDLTLWQFSILSVVLLLDKQLVPRHANNSQFYNRVMEYKSLFSRFSIRNRISQVYLMIARIWLGWIIDCHLPSITGPPRFVRIVVSTKTIKNNTIKAIWCNNILSILS